QRRRDELEQQGVRESGEFLPPCGRAGSELCTGVEELGLHGGQPRENHRGGDGFEEVPRARARCGRCEGSPPADRRPRGEMMMLTGTGMERQVIVQERSSLEQGECTSLSLSFLGEGVI